MYIKYSFLRLIIHDLETLFRDFLWAQGDVSRGKCRIAWDAVCKPIDNGGLGFKRLAIWNRALVTKHIWDVLSRRNTLWVNWIWLHRIQDGSFWSMSTRPSWSWTFRKMLTLRPQVRRFFLHNLGDGSTINAWEDKWLTVGPLSSIISYRRFHSIGFDLHTTVSDVISHCHGVWPNDWIQMNPIAFAEPMPMGNENVVDSLKWLNVHQIPIDYSVKDAWQTMDGLHLSVSWPKYVWFKGCVPKHAFCMWCACHKRLPTQDRIGLWKHDPPDMSCVFCAGCPDSHEHLFFTCPFSREVWRGVKREFGLYGFPESWDMIMLELHANRDPRKIIQKLALSATIYYI